MEGLKLEPDPFIKPAAKYQLFFILLGLVAVCLVLLATSRYGGAMSPDSVGIIKLSRNLRNGDGYVLRDRPWVGQPPLYPALLTIIGYVTGLDALSFAHILNAVLFGLIVYLSGLISLQFFSSSTLLVFLGAITGLLSKPLFYVSTHIWSEPIFICFVLAFILSAQIYMTSKRGAWLIIMALLAAFASLTRLIGISLVFSGAIIVCIAQRDNWRMMVRRLIVFGLISTLPLAGFAARNWIVAGTLFGARIPSSTGLFQNVCIYLVPFLSWYVPVYQILPLFTSSNLAAAVGLALTFQDASVGRRLLRFLVNPPVLFAIIYLAYVFYSVSTIALPGNEHRYLAPLYTPLTLIFLRFVYNLAKKIRGRLSDNAFNVMFAACFAIWSLFPATALVYNTVRSMKDGAGGYNSRMWRESETIRYLRSQPLDLSVAVYSNAYDAIYILANIEAKLSPYRFYDVPPEVTDTDLILDGAWPEGDQAYLVWLDNKHRSGLYTVDELRTLLEVELIAEFEDGEIYLVSK